MSRDFDFVVIGATVGGLAAASYLARSGARVLVVEKQLAPPEPRGLLFALDQAMIADLKLAQHGLSFRTRDLGLTGWDDEEPPLTLPRDRRAAARAIAAISESDAEAWGPFQAELQARAQALAGWWAEPRHEGRAADLLWQPGARRRFARECVTGAADFLARHFESPRLRRATAAGHGRCRDPGVARPGGRRTAGGWRAHQRPRRSFQPAARAG